MRFKVKELKISGGINYIAVINELTAGLSGIHASSRLRLTDHKKGAVIAVADIADEGTIGRYEIGLFNEIIKELKLKDGDEINVTPISQPKSVDYIKEKLDGLELNAIKINAIVKDIVENHLSQVEMSAFVTACYTRNLTMDETYYLTKAIVNSGNQLKFGKGIIADKHCIGGISGNRTTMILVPIIASLGIKIPKTSSRSITSPAGTADTMEVLAPVKLSLKKIKRTVNKTSGCIVWGGAMNLAAADDKLINIRHPLALDPLGLMLASIMAKKKAAGSSHVIIDIPLGMAGKIKTIGEAKYLSRQFEELGTRLGMTVRVIITEGNYPIGKGIGPLLEARDVLWILENNNKGPKDLREKSLYLTGELLELCNKADPGEGIKIARKQLENGEALKKFKEIIKAQGGKWIEPGDLKPAKYTYEIKAQKSGVINYLNDDEISKIARIAGAPLDKAAGIYLNKGIDDYVYKGSTIMTIHSESKRLLDEAVNHIGKDLYIIK